MQFSKMTIFLIILMLTAVSAQDKKLTLEDIIFKNSTLYPEKLLQIQSIPYGNYFGYIKKSDNKNTLVRLNADNGSEEFLLSLNDLNNIISSSGIEKFKSFPKIIWEDLNIIKFWRNNILYQLNVSEKSINQLLAVPEDAENIDLTDNNSAAFAIKNNLFISTRNKHIQLTNVENEWIKNGQSVHRNEFGITKGTFWSPGENYLAYYRMDETMVTDYPLVDLTKRPAELQKIKYPMAGMTSHEVTLGVYDINKGTTTFMKTGEPKDQYLTSVTWSPDEKYIYIGLLNRDQNHLRVIQFDVVSGDQVKTLFEEKSEKYIEPEHPLIFINNNPEQFIWFSERDGWNHLYLYNKNGELIKQLTKGEWIVTALNGSDGEETIFFTSTMDSPIERHLYSLEINSGAIKKITDRPGYHDGKLSSSGKYLMDSYSSINTPNVTILKNLDSNAGNIIYSAADPLRDYEIGHTKIFTINNENTELYCRMILPGDFDSTKKYPVLVYVYGGPHDQLVTNNWFGGGDPFLYYIAQNGFIVFTLDNRGSDYRGLEFEQATFRNLGKIEIEDQAKGIEYLNKLGYIDKDRIGVYGWSYGGFISAALMLRKPELFKAGAAGGTIVDWSYYEVMYTERYMDTPENNPAGYNESSLLQYVDKLKGKLLLVHGTNDPTVVWQHSLLLVKQAACLNIPLEYFPYPGHGHGVSGKDNLHLHNKIAKFFIDNL